MASQQAVIFWPGVLGSELYMATPDAVNPLGVLRWINKLYIANNGIFGLWLAADGLSPPSGYGVVSGSGPLRGSYGQFLDWLQSQGYLVVTAQADFRRTLAVDAATLNRTLTAYYGITGQPVHLVGHSRGGLVIRYALSQLTIQQRQQMVGKVVTIGTPHLGSWEAVGLAAGWSGVLPVLRTLLQFNLVAAIFSNLDPLYAITSWPGVYELFPPPGGVFYLAPWTAQIYALASWAGNTYQPTQALLTAAQATWAAMPKIPADVQALYVAGYGANTKAVPGSQADWSGAVEIGTNWQFLDGDNTVPAEWATYISTDPYVVTPCAHSQLCSDARLYPFINAWLSGFASGPAVSITGRYLDSLLPF